MIKIIMKNGDVFFGNDIKDLVDKLRRDCKVPSKSKIGYKFQLAKRFKVMYGKKLNYISDEEFLYGLFEAEEIKSIEDENNEEIYR